MHSVFYHGTVEWRLFNSTLHAGEAKANIILAMAISAQGINQKYTQFRKTPIGDNPAFTFRTFLLRLGLIGPEYKNVRMHLLKNLPGDKAWRHDKSLYPSNQPRLHTVRFIVRPIPIQARGFRMIIHLRKERPVPSPSFARLRHITELPNVPGRLTNPAPRYAPPVFFMIPEKAATTAPG